MNENETHKREPKVTCTRCGIEYPASGAPFNCSCGGVYDYAYFPVYAEPKLSDRQPGIFVYHQLFGLEKDSRWITLGEGNTPLLDWRINGKQVFLKMEGQNPTGSYKDRGSAVLTSFLLGRGVRTVVEDSSGNAGASLAAYCARANLPLSVYIPESASGPKRWQIEMYGAKVHRIAGERARAAEAVLREAFEGRVYASHAYMPFGLPGIATIAYELYQQLGDAPGTLIAPVGHGGLLYGIMLGFTALRDSGAISRLPYYIGVQSESCAPLVLAYTNHLDDFEDIQPKESLAEGASVSKPVRGSQILRRMYAGYGEMQSAREDQIFSVYSMTARAGIFCEPTACLSLIPLLNDKIEMQEPVVAILTGAGLKTGAIISANNVTANSPV